MLKLVVRVVTTGLWRVKLSYLSITIANSKGPSLPWYVYYRLATHEVCQVYGRWSECGRCGVTFVRYLRDVPCSVLLVSIRRCYWWTQREAVSWRHGFGGWSRCGCCRHVMTPWSMSHALLTHKTWFVFVWSSICVRLRSKPDVRWSETRMDLNR